MLINTKFLGNIEIEENSVLSFERGIPGFMQLNKFVLLKMEENPSLSYLQSLDETNICFVVMDPFLILENYDIELSEDTVQLLDIKKSEDVSLYSILSIPDNVKDITANLIAPVVINNLNNKACQEVLNTDKYSVKYKLFREE